ncbi:MAG: PspC domain-containing protein [Porphyromonas sp.]|nr:PspC domain-containing protein [Porphyromonas sp.]
MKKTININLAGSFYNLEEEAYNILNQYLKSLHNYFYQDDPEGEIVSDLERRIADLFSEQLSHGYDVITTKMTREVLEQVGKVEDIIGEDMESNEHTTHSEPGNTKTAEARAEEKTNNTKEFLLRNHKLYRNPNDRMVAGVFGGLKHLIGIDPNIMRVIFILLLFTPAGGALFLIYLAYWIFVPKAITVEERLEMEGCSVTPESILHKISQDSYAKRAPEVETLDEVTKPAKKSKSNTILWIITALLFIILLGGSIFWIIKYTAGLFEAPFWESMSNVTTLSELFAVTGAFSFSTILFLLSSLLIVVVVIAVILIIVLLPIGLILRSRTTAWIRIVLLLIAIILWWACLV